VAIYSLDAVIFDLDGVLVNTIDLHFQAWKAVANTCGRDLSARDMEKLRGVRRDECLRILFPNKHLTASEIDDLLQIKHDCYIEALFREPVQAILIDGALDLVHEILNRGIPIGVASSSVNAQMILEYLGMATLFDIIAGGQTVVRSKPFPDVFLWVAGVLKAHPTRTLVIEDSIAGITGAKNAGMMTLGVVNENVCPLSDYYYEQLNQVEFCNLLSTISHSVT
jgi:beta-phosphoglucomutase